MENSVTLTEKIASTLEEAERPLHIKEIAEDFVGIPESTIRGRLNENVWKLFQRVGKWLYVLQGEKGTIWLINGNARNLDDKFEPNSIDLLISDHAWEDEKSHTGGTRNFASSYDCFRYDQRDFDQAYSVLKEGCFLVEFLPEKNENNRHYLQDIERMAEQAWCNTIIKELQQEELRLNIPETQFMVEYVNTYFENGQTPNLEEYKLYLQTLLAYTPNEEHKNAIRAFMNNAKFKKAEQEYGKTGFRYFTEVNISWGNSNIGRKKKYISTVYFFTKWDASKLKIWDEKLAKDIKTSRAYILGAIKDMAIRHFSGNQKYMQPNIAYDFYNLSTIEDLRKHIVNNYDSAMVDRFFEDKEYLALREVYDRAKDKYTYLKDEYRIDFKKVYSEVLHVEPLETIDRKSENFDFNISKNEAEYILLHPKEFKSYKPFEIMCKEYGEDDDWQEVWADSIREDGRLDDDYKTFSVWLSPGEKDNTSVIESFISEIEWKKIISSWNESLWNNFNSHIENGALPHFKKINKFLEYIEQIERHTVFPETQRKEYELAQMEVQSFRQAFGEYIEFLQQKDSYKMGTKTILPEFYIGKLDDEKRHESQKPRNVYEDILLQTTVEWSTVVERFAGSLIGAEAVIRLGEEWRGWRNYFAIEMKESIYNENVRFLREKYKNFKFLTYDDFYQQLPQEWIDLVNNSDENRSLKLTHLTVQKINEDLSSVLEATITDLGLVNLSGDVVASNIEAENWSTVMRIKMLANKSEKNKLLQIRVNKTKWLFEIFNINNEKVNEIRNLREWMVKLYNTFTK